MALVIFQEARVAGLYCFLAVLMCLWWQRGMHWQLQARSRPGHSHQTSETTMGGNAMVSITFSIYFGLNASSSSASSPSPCDHHPFNPDHIRINAICIGIPNNI